jgi:hypothetical protein
LISADTKEAISHFSKKFPNKILFLAGIEYTICGWLIRDTLRSQKDELADLFLLSRHKGLLLLNIADLQLKLPVMVAFL